MPSCPHRVAHEKRHDTRAVAPDGGEARGDPSLPELLGTGAAIRVSLCVRLLPPKAGDALHCVVHCFMELRRGPPRTWLWGGVSVPLRSQYVQSRFVHHRPGLFQPSEGGLFRLALPCATAVTKNYEAADVCAHARFACRSPPPFQYELPQSL